jgi:uncharacterized protein
VHPGQVAEEGRGALTMAERGCLLREAAKRGDLAQVNSLLDGPNPPALEWRDEAGWGALVWAAHHGMVRVVEALLSRGAHPDRQEATGCTPLMLAAVGGHAAVVQVLLDHGAAIDARNRRGFTAVNAAARYGRPEVVRLLVTKGADLTLRDQYGRTPRENAATEAVAELLRTRVSGTPAAE